MVRLKGDGARGGADGAGEGAGHGGGHGGSSILNSTLYFTNCLFTRHLTVLN